MAVCGAQEFAEEKADKPKRLFNYKPAGVRSPDYIALTPIERKYDSQEEYVDNARKVCAEAMEPLTKNPMFIDAVEKNITTEFIVKRGPVSDGDITVYMHRPKTLPKKGCAAMVFVHGGGGIAGRAKHFIPLYAFTVLCYGVVGFNVDYRLAPEHGNKGGTDVYAALKYIHNNAEKLGIDKNRIGMQCQSAGAYHAFNACNIMAQKGETGMCKMIISEVGMFTSVMRFTSEKDWEGEELVQGPDLDMFYKMFVGDKYKEYINNKDPNLFPELVEEDKLKRYPPVAFFSAEFCAMHKGNVMFSQRLEKVGKLLEFRLIPGLGHLFAVSNGKETQAVYKDCITCVNVYLKN